MAQQEQREIFQVSSKPGITRDATVLDRPSYIDAQWTRFQRGRPKKMGGYKEIAGNISDIVRGCTVYSKGQLEHIYGFGAARSWIATTTSVGVTSVASVATLPGLPDEDAYTFQIDSIFDSLGTGVVNLLVHPARNLLDIADETNTKVYETVAGVNSATYTAIQDGEGNDIEVSGGVVVLQPFVFAYGNNGLIKNSNENNPNNWVISPGTAANEANVAGTKIVKGLPYRAGSSSPAGLFWSLDSLIRVSRAGSDFRYDTVSAQTSIISPNSVVEYDGTYYWIGVDRFLSFNGTVNEIPNNQNLNWFFDNVNYACRTKIWAHVNTRYGEIWWHFPFGLATECDYAIIYNVRENIWYDTRSARGAGFAARVFRYPVMFGNQLNSAGKYSAFVHEFGLNAISNYQQLAIPAYFETHEFGYPTGGAAGEQAVGQDYWTRLIRIEPDFVQTGAMSVVVSGQEFAQGEVTSSAPYVFSKDTTHIDMREQRRHIRLKFTSNTLNGNFEMGRVIVHTEPGDIRS